jgi:hypothetical protein
MTKNKRTEGKIKTDYGITDYYKFFKTDNPELDIPYDTYTSIISQFNKEVIDLIINNNIEYSIPYLGSTLSIKKDKRVPKIVNGKLYNTSPVDWVATNKLWEEHPETKIKKLLVRYLNSHTSKYVFRIYFKKYKLYFKNKALFSFKTNRGFSRKLGIRINDEDLPRYDTHLLY